MGDFGGPGGGFLSNRKSIGNATTGTIKKKATTGTTQIIPRTTKRKTKRKTPFSYVPGENLKGVVTQTTVVEIPSKRLFEDQDI